MSGVWSGWNWNQSGESEFFFISIFSRKLIGLYKKKCSSELPALVSLLNGAVAGLVAKAIVYPLDLAKKRLQIQGFGEHRRNYGAHFQCRGAWHCFEATVRQEGFTGI